MRLKQTILTLLLTFIGMSAMAQGGNLMRGDVNGDGTVNGTDIQESLSSLVAIFFVI